MDDKVLKAINSLDRKFGQKMDQGFKEVNKNLDELFEKKFINLFNQGFEEIVRPEIEYLREEMESRFDKGESDMSDVKGRLASLDRKVDRIAAKQSEQDIELKDHGKRLRKVEISARVA